MQKRHVANLIRDEVRKRKSLTILKDQITIERAYQEKVLGQEVQRRHGSGEAGEHNEFLTAQ